VIEKLGPCHVLAFEQRGHGRSTGGPVEHWRSFSEDLAAFVRSQKLSNAIGVGHSMGAHALVDAAAATDAFSRLVLLDPTIAAPQAYAQADEYSARFKPGEGPSARRRNLFESVEDMQQRLGEKGSFPLFTQRAFLDYCRFGLLPSADGGLELACSPAVESRVYLTARTNTGIIESVRALTIPVNILRAKEPQPGNQSFDFSFSPTWPGLVKMFQRGRETHYPETSHFIPMQEPDEVARVLLEEIASWSPLS
jgi:lipase